ncbi:hypothetical protein [Poriferisphaera corsica]|nr:hypothetical protein [Poriferisphaera corsica]
MAMIAFIGCFVHTRTPVKKKEGYKLKIGIAGAMNDVIWVK